MPIVVNGAINVRKLYVNGVEQSEAYTNDNTEVFPPYSFLIKPIYHYNGSRQYKGFISPLAAGTIVIGDLYGPFECWPVSETQYVNVEYLIWTLDNNGSEMFRMKSFNVGSEGAKWLNTDLLGVKWTGIETGDVIEFELPWTTSAFYKGMYHIDDTVTNSTSTFSKISSFFTANEDKWVRCDITLISRGQHG